MNMIRQSLLILLLAFIGCTTNAVDLIGKWQAPNQSKIEFMKDGDFYITYAPPGPYEIQFLKGDGGTYSIIDDGRIKLKMGGEIVNILEFTISGDTLTTKNLDGVVTVYKRIK